MARKRNEFYEEIKGLLKEYFDKIFDDYPKKPNIIPSLRKIGSKFDVARNFVKKYLLNYYLPLKFDHKFIEIYKQYWPNSRPDDTLNKYNELINLFSSQFMRYYPQDIDKIDSIGKLSKRFKVGFVSVKAWIMNYLNELYNSNIAKEIYEKIFPTLSSKSPSFKDIKSFIENRRGILITEEIEWNNMKEQPTKRYISVKCKKNHIWMPIVFGFIYDNRWCPTCNESRSEELSRLFMEAIFSVASGTNIRFPTTTLHRAFRLDLNQGGRMHFDGYNNNVQVKGQVFRVAFEYDGIQHDEFPNFIHKDLEEFETLQERDKLKNEICKQPEYKTVLIRLKEKFDFNYDHPHIFQKEIIRQFQNKTRINLPPIPKLTFNNITNTLKEEK